MTLLPLLLFYYYPETACEVSHEIEEHLLASLHQHHQFDFLQGPQSTNAISLFQLKTYSELFLVRDAFSKGLNYCWTEVILSYVKTFDLVKVFQVLKQSTDCLLIGYSIVFHC